MEKIFKLFKQSILGFVLAVLMIVLALSVGYYLLKKIQPEKDEKL